MARDFGASFAAALEKAPVGEWVGPIDSSFGAHYVRVSDRTPAVAPQLAAVRDQVVREWENERRQRARNDAYAKMRGEYEVSIETKLPTERPMRTLSLSCSSPWRCSSPRRPARADEFKPGYLQLTQLDHETYDVLWKIPAIDESTTLKVKPQFPDGTEALTEVRSTFSRGITVQRWRIRVPDGLDGKAILFSQLSETRIDVLARLVRLDGSVQLERILPVSPASSAGQAPVDWKWSGHTPSSASSTS